MFIVVIDADLQMMDNKIIAVLWAAMCPLCFAMAEQMLATLSAQNTLYLITPHEQQFPVWVTGQNSRWC